MAGIVLGLAKSAVEGTLSKVKSAMEEEAELKVRVQDDLVFITGEFQMMQSFLKVASEERAKNEVVRTWVRQVRDLAYDTEDCFELIFHLDKKSAWSPSWLWRLVPSFVAPARPLDEVVTEIKKLKARVEDVSQRNMRYNLIGDSGSKPSAPDSQQSLTTRQGTPAAGKNKQRAGGVLELTEWICSEDEDLKMIFVCGTGSEFGATSIIRNSCNQDVVRGRFRTQAWVKLVHPSNQREFMETLLTQIRVNDSSRRRDDTDAAAVRMDLKRRADENIISDLRNYCRRYKCVIVLEELSSEDEWDTVKGYLRMAGLADHQSGHRIVVQLQTHKFEVASSCPEKPYRVQELRQLSHDHPVYAFSKEDFHADQNSGRDARKKNSGRISSSRRRMEEAAHYWIDNFKLVGRQREMLELRCHIRSADHLDVRHHVTSVWGMAGVGKSALVRNIYHIEVLEPYFHSCIWVDLTHPFNLAELSWQILSGSTLDAAFKDPIQMSCVLLNTHRYLMVIDGLRSTEEWDSIKGTFFSGKTNASVVVITNEASLAAYCADGAHSVVNLKGLEADVALQLFTKIRGNPGQETRCQAARFYSELALMDNGGRVVAIPREITHPSDSGKEDIHIEETSVLERTSTLKTSQLDLLNKETGTPEGESAYLDMQHGKIVAKCGGIPKVIVHVAKYLSDHEYASAWTDLSAHFMDVLQSKAEFHDLRDLIAWMHSYLRTCPDVLKLYIFYLSIFPADQNIRRRRLVRRWIAESYSRDSDGSTAEENGEMFVRRLFDLNMIQLPPQHQTSAISTYTRMVSCQINGFFLEFISAWPIEDNLIFALEGRCRLNTQRTGQHLVIGSSWDRDINVFESIDFSRLRSLTVFGRWESFFITDKMRLLRVLDLENTSDLTDYDLEDVVELLPRLKFLSVRGCGGICCLPSSLDRLRQLQTLDVRNTSVVKLPSAIIKLEKLQYVRAGRKVTQDKCQASTPSTSRRHSLFRRRRLVCGVKVPTRIGKLTNLDTLGVVRVDVAGGETILKEIKKLTQLRKLGVCGVNRRNSQGLCSAVSGHGHLESLSVRLNKDKDKHVSVTSVCCLDDVVNPPETLQSLKLYGLADKFPVWIKQLHNLRKLYLEMTKLSQEQVHVLAGLPCLRILLLRVEDGELHFQPEVSVGRPPKYFRSLVVLDVACSSKLQIIFGERSSSSLEETSEATEGSTSGPSAAQARIMESLELLKVHVHRCSESQFSLSGLEQLPKLREVSVTGSCKDELKQVLQEQLDRHPNEVKPVLKYVGTFFFLF